MLARDAAEYAHMAGRTGRVGQAVGAAGGLVTSVLGSAEEVASLKGIVEEQLGRTLQLSAGAADELASDEAVSAEERIRRLDDMLLLDADEGDDVDDLPS